MRLHEITNAPGEYLSADSEVEEMMDELLQTLGKLRRIRQNNELASTETDPNPPMSCRNIERPPH